MTVTVVDYRFAHIADEYLLVDARCEVDPDGHIPIKVGHYVCEQCGWPAKYMSRSNVWVVIRPFIIHEEPW